MCRWRARWWTRWRRRRLRRRRRRRRNGGGRRWRRWWRIGFKGLVKVGTTHTLVDWETVCTESFKFVTKSVVLMATVRARSSMLSCAVHKYIGPPVVVKIGTYNPRRFRRWVDRVSLIAYQRMKWRGLKCVVVPTGFFVKFNV